MPNTFIASCLYACFLSAWNNISLQQYFINSSLHLCNILLVTQGSPVCSVWKGTTQG